MSRIVCNSGPLIALGILGKLELLQSIFSEVFVPDAVQKEIAQGGVKLAGLENFQRAQWIRIVSPTQNDVLLSACWMREKRRSLRWRANRAFPQC